MNVALPTDRENARAESASGRSEELRSTASPLRVAYVVHTFHMGGLERFVSRMANHLDRTRFSPSVVCLGRNGDAAKWIEKQDVPIVEIGKRPGNDWRAIGKLARALRDLKADIAHSHNWGTLVETAVARRRAGTAIHVHGERGMELEDLRAPAWRKKIRGLMMRWAFRRANAVVAVAEAVRQRIVRQSGFQAEQIQIIPNGVDRPVAPRGPMARAVIRRSLDVADDAILVGSVGRLVPVKDFSLLIQAIGRLICGASDIHLVLVGDGPLRCQLQADAVSAGIADHVHVVGQQDAVGDWLAAMDIYVNSSLNEGMSQSVLEAMAAGLPLLVADVGDSAAMVGGESGCGIVVPPGDIEAMSTALNELCADPDRRRTLGTRAIARHQSRYAIEVMVAHYELLYEQLAAVAPRPAKSAT